MMSIVTSKVTLKQVRKMKTLVILGVMLPLMMVEGFAAAGQQAAAKPLFKPIQTDLFSAPGAQSNAWADFDNDDDLDLLITFRNAPVRLYRNGPDGFEDVGVDHGLPTDGGNPRSIAWGDYDGDGDLDVYIGYSGREGIPNRLFRNNLMSGRADFTEVGESVGVAFKGMTRQVSFVDYDADGDLDLFVAFRFNLNRLLQNNAGIFSDVTRSSGLVEVRRTVGACWFDMDADGDLDLFTANANGDRDGMFRNDNGRFSDVAMALDMDLPRRPVTEGSIGCAVTDYDTDGDLDLYVAAYGNDRLYRNNGDGTFTNVASEMGIAIPDHIVTGVWGDFQNDGRPDLYTVGYINGKPGAPDFLFVNQGARFDNQIPDIVARNDADHGAQWADFDQDGDLDLALASNDPSGSHYLFRNDLPDGTARRSIQILVVDEQGHYTRAGSEVRVYRAGTNNLLGLRIVDTGSGYNSQNAMPVHIGLKELGPVDIRITTMSNDGPRITIFKHVDPLSLNGKAFVAKVGN